MIQDLAAETRAALDRLESEGIPHMLVGGVALDVLGVPRSTVDVDVQVHLPDPPPAHASTFLGWVVEERTRDPVFGQTVLIVHAPASPLPLEIFLSEHWFTRQALDRRVHVQSTLLGGVVPVPTPEDFLLLKTAYMSHPSRTRGKAAQDLVDLEGVVRHHEGRLDEGYVERNARKLDVWDAVEPILTGS